MGAAHSRSLGSPAGYGIMFWCSTCEECWPLNQSDSSPGRDWCLPPCWRAAAPSMLAVPISSLQWFNMFCCDWIGVHYYFTLWTCLSVLLINYETKSCPQAKLDSLLKDRPSKLCRMQEEICGSIIRSVIVTVILQCYLASETSLRGANQQQDPNYISFSLSFVVSPSLFGPDPHCRYLPRIHRTDLCITIHSLK